MNSTIEVNQESFVFQDQHNDINAINGKGICICQCMKTFPIVQKLREILQCLEKQLFQKDQQIQKVKSQAAQSEKNKDEVIKRIAKAYDQLSKDNLNLLSELKILKQRTFPQRIKVSGQFENQTHKSDMKTVDSSFRNKTEVSYSHSESKVQKSHLWDNFSKGKSQRYLNFLEIPHKQRKSFERQQENIIIYRNLQKNGKSLFESKWKEFSLFQKIQTVGEK